MAKKKIFSTLYCRLGLFRLYKNAAIVTNLLFGIFSANTTLDARSFYQDLAAQSCKSSSQPWPESKHLADILMV